MQCKSIYTHMLEAFLSIGGTDGESKRPLGKLTCALGQWTSVGGHFVPLQRYKYLTMSGDIIGFHNLERGLALLAYSG